MQQGKLFRMSPEELRNSLELLVDLESEKAALIEAKKAAMKDYKEQLDDIESRIAGTINDLRAEGVDPNVVTMTSKRKAAQ